MRKNGIIAAPQKLVDATAKFAYGALAASSAMQTHMKKMRRGPIDPVWNAGETGKEVARKISQDARWFQQKKIKSARGVYSAKIKVNLSGMGETYPKKKMEELNPYIDLKIVTRVDSRNRSLASFSSGEIDRSGRLTRKNEIILNLPVILAVASSKGLPTNVNKYNSVKNLIRDSIDHEFRHFTQNAVLDVVSGKQVWGSVPAYEKARDTIGMKFEDPPPSAALSPQDQYLLKKVEYFPWIGNLFADVRHGADAQAKRESQNRPYTLTPVRFDRFMYGSPSGSDYRKFIKALKTKAPDRYERFLVEKTAFINDYNEAVLTRWQQQRYLTPQRVVSEVLLDLDIEDRNLAAWLRKNRAWAEETAQEAL